MINSLIERLIFFCLDGTDGGSKEEYRYVRSFIYVWLSTTVIMWLYVIFSYAIFDIAIVGTLGALYSLVHTLSPLIYRRTKSLIITGWNISITSLLFQTTFCLYNGGIKSPAAIWFTAHPVILSFFGNKRMVLFSVGLNIFIVFNLFYFTNMGYFEKDYLPQDVTYGFMVSSLIGLDLIIAVYTLSFINQTQQHSKELVEAKNLAEHRARTDVLTGINNRRAFSENAENEFARAKRHRQPLALVMFDLDKFKEVNDTYGHAAGDDVIQSAVQIGLNNIRETDTVGRIGGEEFAILFFNTNKAEAKLNAERLREIMELTPVTYNETIIYYTASFGVTELETADETFGTMMKRADDALYESKNAGRNCVTESSAASVFFS